MVDLDPARGSEANKRRPAVIVSNDGANATASRMGRGVLTVVPITSNTTRAFEFQVFLAASATGLPRDGKAQAEQVRGEGDGERNRLFAEAYGKDADFFAFYRSMTAYENSMKSNDTRFLLRPDSEFFRYFANPAGKPAAANGSAR